MLSKEMPNKLQQMINSLAYPANYTLILNKLSIRLNQVYSSVTRIYPGIDK